MATQPVPSVTRADVLAVVARDFPHGNLDAVLAILDQYGTEDYEQTGGVPRVQLACLKLAAGNLDALRQHVASAKMDYRDVLLEAEYPGAGARSWTTITKMSDEKQQELYDADWKQYERWLRRS